MDKIWEAEWIADEAFIGLQPIDLYHKEMEPKELPEHEAKLENVHMLARKPFYLATSGEPSFLDITADDYYKLYVNGTFVGQGPAQGGHDHYFYNRYDVTPFLLQGINVIAVHVYYHGLISRSYNSGDYRQGLMAELFIHDRLVVKTDATWKMSRAREYASGGVIGYNTQILENIDSRLAWKGYREAGFDDTAWNGASVQATHDYTFAAQPTPPVSVYEVKPVSVRSIDAHGYLLDFGKELTGQFKMLAKGRRDQVVEIRCGEELQDGGRVRYEMRCNCKYQEFWTLSGEYDELEIYDYKAFRYVEVLADPSLDMEIDSFAAVVRHYPFDEQACRFEASDTMLKAIWEICKHGVVLGSQENYVDCPSREKGQYLGDNTIITHAHAYVSGDLRLVRKSLEDFALMADRVCPGLTAVAPGSFMQEIADFSLQWPMQLLQYYRHSGDESFVRRMYPTALRMLKHFERYLRSDGLLANVTDKWNLVDWPEGMRDDYDFPLSKPIGEGCHNVINAFYYGALSATAEIRRLLQTTDDLGWEYPDSRLDSFRASYRRAFLDEDTDLFVDAERSKHSSLHANVLPMLFGLAEEREQGAIVDLIRTKRLSCGVYMSYFVLKALSAAGEYGLAYELIRSEDLHSWSTMVKEGATSCFEAWSKELKWNTSLCHPWAAAPIPIIIEEIIGLKPALPGWKQVSFRPNIPDSLTELDLSIRVPTGEIRFTYVRGEITLQLPDGVSIASA